MSSLPIPKGRTRWGILAVVAGILAVLAPSGAQAQSLGGVSCSDVLTNGVAANHPSTPLFTNPLPGDFNPVPQPLPPRYGFDYLGGSALLRNAPGSPCPQTLNDFFVCVGTNGRPGDSDGDGVRMVGAIRSTTQCVSCHDCERGDLLGAFSYTLKRDGSLAAAARK